MSLLWEARLKLVTANWAPASENVTSDVCSQHRLRSTCAFAQSDLNLHLVNFRQPTIRSTLYSTEASDSVSGQWRSWSDCADTQHDVPHMYGQSSHVMTITVFIWIFGQISPHRLVGWSGGVKDLSYLQRVRFLYFCSAIFLYFFVFSILLAILSFFSFSQKDDTKWPTSADV